MGRSLADYAALHPQERPELDKRAMSETARTIKDKQEAREDTEALKASILRQIEAGNAPEIILYSAVKALGIATNDAGWELEARAALDEVYADLAQESLLADNATIAAARLDRLKLDYNAKLRRTLRSQLHQYKKIQTALIAALDAANELDGIETDLPDEAPAEGTAGS